MVLVLVSWWNSKVSILRPLEKMGLKSLNSETLGVSKLRLLRPKNMFFPEKPKFAVPDYGPVGNGKG